VKKKKKLRALKIKSLKKAEEIGRAKKLGAARKIAKKKRNLNKSFKELLHTPAIAPVRSDIEIGILVNK